MAILKMKQHRRPYYNDFNSDRDELRRQPTGHNLFGLYQTWSTKMNQFFTAVKGVTSSAGYVSELHFRRRQNIAYELIMGTIELNNLPFYTGKIRAHYTGELALCATIFVPNLKQWVLCGHCVPLFLFLIINNGYCAGIVCHHFCS